MNASRAMMNLMINGRILLIPPSPPIAVCALMLTWILTNLCLFDYSAGYMRFSTDYGILTHVTPSINSRSELLAHQQSVNHGAFLEREAKFEDNDAFALHADKN